MGAMNWLGLYNLHELTANTIQAQLRSGQEVQFGRYAINREVRANLNQATLQKAANDAGGYSWQKSYIDWMLVGDVLVIPIMGMMERYYNYWNLFGNEEIAELLRYAYSYDRVKAIVLRFDTPGGTADSCKLLAEAVRQRTKKVIAWTNFCCSAGYFVASQCDEIWLEDQAATEIGSIGSLAIYTNVKKAYEEAGIAVQIIRAVGSEDKAAVNPYEDVPEDVMKEFRAGITACRTEFVGYVRRGRLGKLTDEGAVLTGKTFGVRDAIRLGLADRTGTLQQAIDRATQL